MTESFINRMRNAQKTSWNYYSIDEDVRDLLNMSQIISFKPHHGHIPPMSNHIFCRLGKLRFEMTTVSSNWSHSKTGKQKGQAPKT